VLEQSVLTDGTAVGERQVSTSGTKQRKIDRIGHTCFVRRGQFRLTGHLTSPCGYSDLLGL
jgi:hypothetical protein